MIKRVANIMTTVLLLLGICVQGTQVFAGDTTQSTGNTLSVSVTGEICIAQDAYLPVSAYLDLSLNNPQDLFIKDDIMYIADTDNSRVLLVDIKAETVKKIGVGTLNKPTGVAADDQGRIYVADYGNSLAYRFLEDGKLDYTFEKPKVPSFGKNAGYRPVKVAPGEGGGVYLVSEGSQAGIVQISGMGEFLGYFASNKVDMSIFEKIIDLILTEQQKSSFLKRTPPSFGNIFRGDDGLVYTMNNGDFVSMKKHSISGLDLFEKVDMVSINKPADMFVTKSGRMLMVDGDNMILEMTPDGYFLSAFGGGTRNENRVGLFTKASGIAADSQSNIYVLDQENNSIQIFEPTPFQKNIHKAMEDYQVGNYSDSLAILQEQLVFNDTSFFAHIYAGKNYMQLNDYENAAYHYKVANSKYDYSDAYWEIRNIWMQKNLIVIMWVLIAIAALVFGAGLLKKYTKVFAPIIASKEKLKQNRFISDIVKIKYAMLHPIDSAYEIKVGNTGSYGVAMLIYGICFILLVAYQIGTGFILSASNISDYSLFNVFMSFFVILLLFVIIHYQISAINDGRATFKSVFLTCAYGASPMVIFVPFLIILANFITIDEKFFLDFSIMLLIVWTICNIIAGLIDIQDYSFGQIVSNILVTLFTMGVAVLGASVGYLLIKQIINFVYEIIVEVSMRV